MINKKRLKGKITKIKGGHIILFSFLIIILFSICVFAATPSISMASPVNQSYNNRTILVNISASGAESVWWFNGTANLTYTTSAYHNFSEGSNMLIAYANDSAGNLNYTNVTFFVDSVYPQISFINLTGISGSIIANNRISVNITANDTNLASVAVNLYNYSGNLVNSVNSTYYCYQETSNKSAAEDGNCDLNYNGSYALTETWSNQAGLYDGLWTDPNRGNVANSGNIGYFYINYSKPANAINGTLWQVKVQNSSIPISPVTVNLSVPIDCWNQNPNLLQLSIVVDFDKSYPNDQNNSINETCWNGTGWKILLKTQGIIIWEEAIIWNVIFSGFTNVSDGLYFFNATALDTAGNSNSTETRNVTVDTIAPAISIVSPANQTYSNRTILVNISASDINGISKTWYNWNGTNLTYTSAVYVAFAEGSNTIIFYANDSAGNLNQTSVLFAADTTAPAISIVNPAQSSLLSSGTAQALIEINTNETAVCRYNLTNSTFEFDNGINFTNTSSLNHSFLFAGLGAGTFNLYYKCNDSVGNVNANSTAHTFSIASFGEAGAGLTGGGSSVNAGEAAPTFPAVPTNPPIPYSVKCSENWQCTNWSSCINEKQTRKCTDINNCRTALDKPIESLSCLPEITGAETGDIIPLEAGIGAIVTIIGLVIIWLIINGSKHKWLLIKIKKRKHR